MSVKHLRQPLLPCSDQSVCDFAYLKIVGNTLNAVLASLEATAKEEMTSKDFEGAIESDQKKVEQHYYQTEKLICNSEILRNFGALILVLLLKIVN